MNNIYESQDEDGSFVYPDDSYFGGTSAPRRQRLRRRSLKPPRRTRYRKAPSLPQVSDSLHTLCMMHAKKGDWLSAY